ncbi:MAG: hypothetical protein ACYS8I_13500 [Planctomycetota bacterium]
MMNTVKKIFMLVLIVAVVSLGLIGCKKKSEHPTGDHPSSDHPSKEDATKEHPSSEHPSSEHPGGEHPK